MSKRNTPSFPFRVKSRSHVARWLPGSEQRVDGPGRQLGFHTRPSLCLPARGVGLRPRLAVASPCFDLGPCKVPQLAVLPRGSPPTPGPPGHCHGHIRPLGTPPPHPKAAPSRGWERPPQAPQSCPSSCRVSWYHGPGAGAAPLTLLWPRTGPPNIPNSQHVSSTGVGKLRPRAAAGCGPGANSAGTPLPQRGREPH